MAIESINPNVPGNSPDTYESSYNDIFTYANFNFLVFVKLRSTSKVGRRKPPAHAIFGALILNNLALNSSFRTTEAILKQYSELAARVRFSLKDPLSDSVLRCIFASLKLKDIQAVHARLLEELRELVESLVRDLQDGCQGLLEFLRFQLPSLYRRNLHKTCVKRPRRGNSVQLRFPARSLHFFFHFLDFFQ